MNDLCKVISIVSGIIITGIFLPFLDFAYGESDFVLEMSNASSNNEKLTLFAIEGETYRGGICPSGQCNLEGNIDPFFSPPNPDRTYMSFDVDFILRDNVPNPNIGPNEKAYLRTI